MRKYIIVLLALALLLCAGCKKQEPVQTEAPTTAPTETTIPPTTEETIPVPELTMGSALVDDTPAILDTLMRDDVVDVVGEYDEDHYVIKTDLGYGLVKKGLLRLESEAAYEVWTGYAYWNAEVYDNLHLTGEPAQKLKTNTKVEVLDDLGYCYVVRVEETEGFMNKSRLTKWHISSGGGSSNSGGGGSSSGSGGGGGGSTGADGGDISLQFHGNIVLLAAIEQSGDVTGQATILADGTEVVLGYFERGEEIPMVAEDGLAENREGYVTVYLDGLYAYVPQKLVLTQEAEAYEAWDGYSRWNGVVYDNFYLLGDPIDKLYTNVKVHVIAELENCYLVEVNEVTGYMSKDLVSQTRISTGGRNSDSGGSGGGGNSGGGGSSGGGAEWSPPAL